VEISELKIRVKNSPSTASKIENIFSQGILLDLALPFGSDVSDKCEDIMKLQQYQAIQNPAYPQRSGQKNCRIRQRNSSTKENAE
jgi:hypothetical protein